MADSPDLCAMIVFGKTTEIVKRNTPSKTDTMCYASCRTLGGGAWHKNSLWWSLYHFVMLHPLGPDTMCQFCLECVYPETFLRFDTTGLVVSIEVTHRPVPDNESMNTL